MEKEKPQKRIYLIEQVYGTKERLIEAISKSSAISYAVKTSIKAELASQRDLVRLTGEGVLVENEDADGMNSGV